MGSIVTIGGGEFTRREIDRIDRRTLELTGKTHPVLLYIPTASNDEEGDLYDEYFAELGYKIEKLFLINETPSVKAVREAVFSADAIFAGGGDAIFLMDTWKKYTLDSIMREAFHETDIVLSGISAGSICWFELGHTDSLSYHAEDWDYYRMHGCGLIPAIHSPHFCEHRKNSIERWMKYETLPAAGLDNCCALEYSDGTYKVLTSDGDARAHIYRNNGKDGFTYEILSDGEEVKL